MSFVVHNGKIVPASLFEPLFDDRKPDCFVCNDTGIVRETIDEERLDVMFPCWRCRQRKEESK